MSSYKKLQNKIKLNSKIKYRQNKDSGRKFRLTTK
jgi:hypothetical protein